NRWDWSGRETGLEDLADDRTELSSAYAAGRLLKALCCIYEQEYEMVHKINYFTKYLPDDHEAPIRKMNGTAHDLHISSYEGQPMESCQDSINRVIYTLDLLDKIVKQGDVTLSEEELTHIQVEYEIAARPFQKLSEEEVHPDISIIKSRMDRMIEGLSNRLAHDVSKESHPSKKSGRFD
ncbi:MAG: hypothetical protein OXC80_06720, partial [Gammaproteobacteria bacterium]|nr:hypothetical protein [Gammaproteobacteria bacterium]